MKLVKVKGGLGNQLFQYSFAYLLKQLTNEEVKIDMSSYRNTLNDSIRKPRLLKMNISLQVASDQEVSSICFFKHRGDILTFKYRAKTFLESLLNKNYFLEKDRAYINPKSITKDKYFDGYWQSWRYIEPVWNELRKELIPNYPLNISTQRMIDEVSNIDSVFIGVRKGDYSAESSHYGSFGNTYYQKAMDFICNRIKDPVFYIFSNDIPWVKDNIDFQGRKIIYRNPEDIVDDFEDFLIMSACKHSIIVNSTYHWWGARLNDSSDKLVIAPKHWFFDDKPIDIIPPNWVRIEP